MLAVLALLLAASTSPAGELKVTFIGNAAFHITDGKTTLVSDFPYRSGAFGYMTYDLARIPPVGEGIALITHDHADHFAPELYRGPLLSLKVFAAPGVARAFPGGEALTPGKPVRFRDVEVQAFATPHGDIAHNSYLVTWHGRKLYFSGDTESDQNLLAMRGLDVAFVSPWLLSGIAKQGKRIDARKIVVSHHRADQTKPPYPGSVVPRQRDTFSIPWSDSKR